MHRVGSLASGYDGLGMALGGERVWFAENDPAASRVLAHHWPDVPNFGDITTIDWLAVEPVDWLTAGYPCQNWSLAGKRKGVNDPRHIWPNIADAIRVLRPRHILLENVYGHLSLGFDVVHGTLAGLGYVVRWGVVEAAEAGAPHHRKRLFILAHADGLGGDRSGPRGRWWQEPAHRGNAPSDADATRLEDGRVEHDGAQFSPAQRSGCQSATADTYGDGMEGREATGRPHPERQAAPAVGLQRLGPGSTGVDWGVYEPAIRRWEAILGRDAPDPTEPGVRTDRRLAAPFVEWMQGLPIGHVTGVPGLSRTHQLKILGNGVVPQQAQLALSLLSAQSDACMTSVDLGVIGPIILG